MKTHNILRREWDGTWMGEFRCAVIWPLQDFVRHCELVRAFWYGLRNVASDGKNQPKGHPDTLIVASYFFGDIVDEAGINIETLRHRLFQVLEPELDVTTPPKKSADILTFSPRGDSEASPGGL